MNPRKVRGFNYFFYFSTGEGTRTLASLSVEESFCSLQLSGIQRGGEKAFAKLFEVLPILRDMKCWHPGLSVSSWQW